MLRTNGHLNLKRGHSLDSMCSHSVPNLVTKNAGNCHSWELNFQNFPEDHLPGPQWWIQGGWGEGWGVCVSTPPFLDFFFYKNEVYEQEISIKRVQNLSQNARNGNSGDSNFQKFSDPLES